MNRKIINAINTKYRIKSIMREVNARLKNDFL